MTDPSRNSSRTSSRLAAAAAGIVLFITPLGAQFVYEGFQYDAVDDSLHGQPDDLGASDTDATGLSGTWADATGTQSANMFLKPGNLVFGDLMATGNHVGFESNANNDIFHRSLASAAQSSLAAAGEIWFSILFEKLQNNFSAGEGGFALANRAVGNTRIYLNDGSDGLAGFGFGPTTAGDDLTAYAWDGTTRFTGDAAIPVPPANGSANTDGSNFGDVRLIVGHVSFDTGTGGADVFTLFDYALNGITVEGGTLNQVAGPLEVDVDQGTLAVVNLTRQVNVNYDELRIGTSLSEVVPFLNYAGWAARWPSADLSDPGADFESDGLTNQEEFELDTDPTESDTDGDGLDDGPEVAGAGLRPATDPTERDTDGDGLDDAAESNTGTWAGMTDTGTNPVAGDSDFDGLVDGVETNTGVYSDPGNSGTDPTDGDSDDDGTGDWYEVAATFTDPTDAGDAPGIPYPLPDPDPDPDHIGATDRPVKVYILSGQSNMVGFGRINGDHPGTLETVSKVGNIFPNLVADGTGGWTTHHDVRYHGVVSDTGKGRLTPDVAGSSFGPELGFGYVMGWHHDEPVLIIKSSIGNRSLSWDCLPPGSARFEWTDSDGKEWTYAGYGDNPSRWETGTTPGLVGWYAGKSFDTFFLDEDDMGPMLAWSDGAFFPKNCYIRHNGVGYRSKSDHTSSPASEPGGDDDWATYWTLRSEINVTDVLDDFAGQYPEYAGQGFEIAGYVWWQGHKDGGEQGGGAAGLAATRYEENLVHLIDALRSYYEARYPDHTVPDAPFVVATVGFGGGDWAGGSSAAVIHEAQMAVGDPSRHPEFGGTVASVDTTGYWRDFGPSNQGYHYNHNAETYMLVGDAIGWAMVALQDGGTTPADNLRITAINPVGGGTWELVLSGAPATAYEFYSSVTLDFNPGALVTGLTQGAPGSDPGTITGDSVVTTDAGGNAVVRVTLGDGPAGFVRASAAP